MAVAVIPRLGELLQARHMTVEELRRQIANRYGLAVDAATLDHLAHAHAVQRADLEIAGAAAAVMGVGLDDVFDVRVTPAQATPPEAQLPPEQSRRLADLLDAQSRRDLSADEERELGALVTASGLLLHEWHLEELARQRGISIAEAREQTDSSLRDALAAWHEIEADPARRRALEQETRRLRQRSAAR
jgi:hypothetical protein